MQAIVFFAIIWTLVSCLFISILLGTDNYYRRLIHSRVIINKFEKIYIAKYEGNQELNFYLYKKRKLIYKSTLKSCDFLEHWQNINTNNIVVFYVFSYTLPCTLQDAINENYPTKTFYTFQRWGANLFLKKIDPFCGPKLATKESYLASIVSEQNDFDEIKFVFKIFENLKNFDIDNFIEKNKFYFNTKNSYQISQQN